jgi:hypothetical protein
MNLPAGFPIFSAGDEATAIQDGSLRVAARSRSGTHIDVAMLASFAAGGSLMSVVASPGKETCAISKPFLFPLQT